MLLNNMLNPTPISPPLLPPLVARLEGELSGVEALRELRTELGQQKESLHLELIDELHKHLYVTPTATRSKGESENGGVRLHAHSWLVCRRF